MNKGVRRLVATAIVSGFVISGCSGGDGSGGEGQAGGMAEGSGAQVTLTGAGATFPYPIYSRWFSDYSQTHAVRVNYQPVGSGGGIRQMIEGTVDFGASDAPLSEEDLAQIPGTLSIPTVIGSVAVTYNLPDLGQPLRLDGATIAGIFLGEIDHWQDPRLVELNPGVALPDRDIIPVHRSDGSGTSYVFTDYLSSVSPTWSADVGRGNAVSWPTGLGARGNDGVTGQVVQTPGGVGYVEQIYALQNDLPMAEIENSSGQFLAPSIEATTAAAAGLEERIPANNDFRLSIVNPDGADAYPIASWTYLLISPHMDDCNKATALLDLVQWALLDGADDAVELSYAPLTMPIRLRALNALKVVTCGSDNRPVFDPDEDFAVRLFHETGERPS